MKKFIVSAICAAVALCSISFSACSDNTADSNSGLINLADCEIGYELPVYPDCEFDYKVSDDCTVHISEIKAVLTAKNEINEGDFIEENFYRYEITLRATGKVTTTTNKTEYTLHLSYGILDPSSVYMITAYCDSSNSLAWEQVFYFNTYVSDIIFIRVV